MGLRCWLSGHVWGDWSEWDETERTQEHLDHGVLTGATYKHYKNRERNCERCGKHDAEHKSIEQRRMDAEEYRTNTEEEESLKAHLEAKDNHDYPVTIGEYVTGGIEDFSTHHSRGKEPIVKHKGFVIFVKNASKELELGSVITVKISSFNQGDSANAVFMKSEN